MPNLLRALLGLTVLCACTQVEANLADDYLAGVTFRDQKRTVREEKAGMTYRDARLERIYDRLKQAYQAANLPYDTSLAIRVNQFEQNNASGRGVYISEEVLKLDDNAVAFVVGHEMAHVSMGDVPAECEKLLAVDALRGSSITFRVTGDASLPEAGNVIQLYALAQVPIAAQLVFLSGRNGMKDLDIDWFKQFILDARRRHTLLPEIYHSREIRADRVGTAMAKAAGFEITQETVTAVLSIKGIDTEGTYDHPSLTTRVSGL